MQFSTVIAALVAGSSLGLAATLNKRADNKANEYTTNNCSGALNYGHKSHSNLGSINMDPTSHSVYVANNWHAFTEVNNKGNGNKCHGEALGVVRGPCVDLDNNEFGQRINCVLNF